MKRILAVVVIATALSACGSQQNCNTGLYDANGNCVSQQQGGDEDDDEDDD